MSPKGLMLTGVMMLPVFVAISFLGDYPASAVMLTFGAGALFGKGYGALEERQEKRNDT